MLLFFTLLLVALQTAGAAAPPNLVIVFADDQGYGDVGVYGARQFHTPNLDRMAHEGVRFTDFYVAAPVCTPSRAALLTGSYPVRVGLGRRVLFPYSNTGLHSDEITLAEVLKEQGYTTGIIGKWHLGHHKKFLPTRQGFDSYFGIPYSNDMGNHWYALQHFMSPPLPILRDEERIEQQPDQNLLTQRYTEEALRFLRANKDRPFFLYLPHSMPHWPLAASARFAGRSELGIYGDAVEEVDWSVGEILRTLKDLGVDERTLVIFSSDNGASVRPWQRRGYRPGSNKPLRGDKNTTWEGGMRVPAIMRWPGKIPAGLVQGELATTMDILPTVAKLAGTEPPRDRILDGKDIWPLMSGQRGAKTPMKPSTTTAMSASRRSAAVRGNCTSIGLNGRSLPAITTRCCLISIATSVKQMTSRPPTRMSSNAYKRSPSKPEKTSATTPPAAEARTFGLSGGSSFLSTVKRFSENNHAIRAPQRPLGISQHLDGQPRNHVAEAAIDVRPEDACDQIEKAPRHGCVLPFG